MSKCLAVDFERQIKATLAELKTTHLYRHLSPCSGLCFIHNDYLDLSSHPQIIEAGVAGAKLHGAGSRGSRLLGGHSACFEAIEERIAQFFGVPDALFFSTGYLANLAVLQVLGTLVKTIVSDEKNHASLIDGIHLARNPKHILQHNRWDMIPEMVQQKPFLCVTESLFSMDGDFVDDNGVQTALKNDNAFLLVDEAHAAGIVKGTGQGYWDKSQVDWKRTAFTVTFGKAFGVAGAAILCSSVLKELLVNKARAFIYTTAPSPVIVAMVEAALKVAHEESWRREELWDRAETVRAILAEAPGEGDTVPLEQSMSSWARRSPIIAFHIPGEERVLRFCENVAELGVGLRAIRYPTVPKGGERIRISLSLAVSRENTLEMAKRLVEQWKAFLLQERIRT